MLMVVVNVASTIQVLTEHNSRILSEGTTLGQVLADVATSYPQLGKRMFRADRSLSAKIMISIDGRLFRAHTSTNMELKANTEIWIYPTLAGG
jgi:molybdopterin converting factor small subunit